MISYDNERSGHGPWEGELLMIPNAQCIMLFFEYKVPQHCVCRFRLVVDGERCFLVFALHRRLLLEQH